MTVKISPNYDSGDLNGTPSIDKKLDVYEDRVKGWTLQWARDLSRREHAGFAALAVALTYFEAHSIYCRGETSKDNSKKFFREAFTDVFGHMVFGPVLAARIADFMYDQGRCGLFHEGMTKAKLRLRNSNGPVTYQEYVSTQEPAEIQINVEKFVEEIEAHFAKYMKRLRDTNEATLRQNFEKSWDRDYDLSSVAKGPQPSTTSVAPSVFSDGTSYTVQIGGNTTESGSHLGGNP
jgi:hypothetical protein